MKKLVLTSLCVIAAAGSVLAQGNVKWDTIPFNAMTAQTNSTTYSTIVGNSAGLATGSGAAGATSVAAAGFYYELLYSAFSGSQATKPTTLSGLATWSDAAIGATNATASAGRLVPINGTAGMQVPWSPGTTSSIVLVGWSANLGTTWTAVQSKLNDWSNQFVANSFFGVSNTGFITTLSTSTSPGASVFGTASTAQGLPISSLNTQLFILSSSAPVPEPTTLALAGLGSAVLLMFRRRNK